MKIELIHNKYGGWVMEVESEHGTTTQYPKTKVDLLERLWKIIMDEL